MSHHMALYHQFQQIYVLLDDGDRRALRATGLTPAQYNLLRQLGDRIKEGVTITELAQRLLCTRGNATRMVQRMAQQELVEVGGDADDQRLVRVALTPAGAEMLEVAHQAHTSSVERRIGALSPAEQQKLAELTQAVVDLLADDLSSESS